MVVMLTVTFFSFYLWVMFCCKRAKQPIFTFMSQIGNVVISLVGTGLWYGLYNLAGLIGGS